MQEAAAKKSAPKERDIVNRQSKPLYAFAVNLLKLTFNNIYRVKFTGIKAKKLDSPCVVLSNHCSYIDWILVGTVMRPKYINIVVTRYFYSVPALQFFMRRLGVIPKDQFTPDVAAVKGMLAAAKQGGNVMLFPEGRMAPGGVGGKIEYSTVKLLRHLKLPVVGVHLYGAYMTWPKWASGLRRGKIEVNTQVILTPEKMAEMTDDEIYECIVNSLKTDETAWQAEHRVKYKCKKIAEGLHNVLYYCPKCGAEHTMTTKKDVIRCSQCGNGARLNKYYDLVPLDESCVIPESIGAWYTMQVERIKQLIADQPDIFMEDAATLHMTGEGTWLQPVGEGTVRLDASGLTYSGTKNGQPFDLFVPIVAIPAMAFSAGKSFELYYKGEFYSFYPSRAIESQKWSMMAEELHNACCE